MRPALTAILRRLDKTFNKIYKKPSIRVIIALLQQTQPAGRESYAGCIHLKFSAIFLRQLSFSAILTGTRRQGCWKGCTRPCPGVRTLCTCNTSKLWWTPARFVFSRGGQKINNYCCFRRPWLLGTQFQRGWSRGWALPPLPWWAKYPRPTSAPLSCASSRCKFSPSGWVLNFHKYSPFQINIIKTFILSVPSVG